MPQPAAFRLPVLIVLGTLLWAPHTSAASLTPTPADIQGPFYPDRLPADQDADLVRVTGQIFDAKGQILELRGRVLDSESKPLENIRIEIWQTDSFGRYIHSSDRGSGRRDPDFQGFGIAVTDADGHYHFRTVRPKAYGMRPEHIHVRILEKDKQRLVTQVYFPSNKTTAQKTMRQSKKREHLQTLQIRGETPQVIHAEFDFILAVPSVASNGPTPVSQQ